LALPQVPYFPLLCFSLLPLMSRKVEGDSTLFHSFLSSTLETRLSPHASLMIIFPFPVSSGSCPCRRLSASGLFRGWRRRLPLLLTSNNRLAPLQIMLRPSIFSSVPPSFSVLLDVTIALTSSSTLFPQNFFHSIALLPRARCRERPAFPRFPTFVIPDVYHRRQV